MKEKDMVVDILNGCKAGLANFSKVITETNNAQLRQKFQQMRDSEETFQYDLYRIAETKGYYVPSPLADVEDINMCKEAITQSLSMSKMD